LHSGRHAIEGYAAGGSAERRTVDDDARAAGPDPAAPPRIFNVIGLKRDARLRTQTLTMCGVDRR
jgi:hypothetical protein